MNPFAIFDLFSLQPRRRGVNPAAIPGLTAWYDARYLDLPDGTPVGLWPDLSGNGHDLTQTTTSRKPVFRQNHLGRPAVVFDGVDDRLMWFGVMDARTLIAVYAVSLDPPTSGKSVIPLAFRDISKAPRRFLIYHSAAGREIRCIAYRDTGAWQGVLAGSGPGANVYFWHAGVLRPNQLEVWKDGALLESVSAISYSPTDYSLDLGYSVDNGNQVAIRTVLLYDRDLSPDELRYLANV